MKKQPHVLYMEDDAEDFSILKEILGKVRTDVHLVHAVNGEHGIFTLEKMIAENNKPCLVFVDINMPLMNGKEVLQWMDRNDLLDSIPVAFLTTSSNPADEKMANDYKIDFLRKPDSYPEYKKIVLELFEKVCL